MRTISAYQVEQWGSETIQKVSVQTTEFPIDFCDLKQLLRCAGNPESLKGKLLSTCLGYTLAYGQKKTEIIVDMPEQPAMLVENFAKIKPTHR